MPKVTVYLNGAGVRELLKSDSVVANLKGRCESICQGVRKEGGSARVNARLGKNRAIVEAQEIRGSKARWHNRISPLARSLYRAG